MSASGLRQIHSYMNDLSQQLFYVSVLFSVHLSAHSMEEADVLCDRLGIFVDGSLQCIGNPKEVIPKFLNSDSDFKESVSK